jgi:hypothetical protein
MSSSKLPAQLRVTFQRSLVAAIANGEVPKDSAGLGPQTISAIQAIARDHPEAAPMLIANAHDTFRAEHFGSASTSNPPNQLLRTVRHRRRIPAAGGDETLRSGNMNPSTGVRDGEALSHND